MRSLLFVLLVHVTACLSHADVRLPRIFTDHMVLQQDKPIRVWGWADKGEVIEVTFNGYTGSDICGDSGQWIIELKAFKADGKEHTLTVKGKNTITLNHIKLGEVWIAAGQSNMNRSIDISKENRPDLKLFWIDFSRTPQKDDLNKGVAGWVPSTAKGLAAAAPFSEGRDAGKPRKIFTEVGYVFGRRLQEDLDVPVGMIRAAVGGSTAKAWTPQPQDYPSKHKFGVEFEKKRYLAHTPGLLYYSMIKGLGPLSVRGVIWYQGEDDGRNQKYAADFTAMINSWRAQFRDPDLPFYFVQIAQTTYASGMLSVWQAQQKVMHSVKHTGLAVSNDIYDGTNHGYAPRPEKVDKDTGWPIAGGSNPHPPNKQLVANRLADIAMKEVYRKKTRAENDVIYGPMYLAHQAKGNKMRVQFQHVGSGLKTRDGKAPNWFELSDGTMDGRRLKYVKADAKIISKDIIELSALGMTKPKFVRFGWHALVYSNLINTEGLPAVSFRTDEQKGHQR